MLLNEFLKNHPEEKPAIIYCMGKKALDNALVFTDKLWRVLGLNYFVDYESYKNRSPDSKVTETEIDDGFLFKYE